ncbi:APC family permease [Thermogemmatispora sp.]|uniref:APC family permease n=1 Tax=Thermogemmatispora sp. TaxID=1968838 RepID=UPI0035E461D6
MSESQMQTSSELSPQSEAQVYTLRKDSLGLFDAIAQSVALLSLEMGIALSSSFAAASAGAAVPLAYVVAGLASLCLAYVIIRFTRRIASAGGLYTYIAQGLGPQAGFIGGWMYGGAFAAGASFTLAISSIFLGQLLEHLGLSLHWFIIFCGLLVLLFVLAFFDVRLSTRTQLLLSFVGLLAVLALAVIILARGGANGISLTPLSPAGLAGGWSSLFFAAIFSFTSFIGFEAAAVLGEETQRPRQAIPWAILTAVLVAIVYYVLVSFAMANGYGTAHIDQWARDEAPLDTLATRYAGAFLATLIDLMVAIGAFSATLAGVVLASRMMFAVGRDGGLPAIFAVTHARYKTPWVAILVVLALTLVLGAALGIQLGPFLFFGFMATTASLGILLAYILVALSGMVAFMRTRARGAGAALTLIFDILLPLIAIAICAFTIYSSVVPVPQFPLNLAPYIAAVWLLIGIGLLIVLQLRSPQQVQRFGKILGEHSSE